MISGAEPRIGVTGERGEALEPRDQSYSRCRVWLRYEATDAGEKDVWFGSRWPNGRPVPYSLYHKH